MDDAYLGGARSGGNRGRGSPGKTPFVVAVETTVDGKGHRVKLRRVRRFTKKVIKAVTSRIVTEGAHVVTYGLRCFNGVADAGSTHERSSQVLAGKRRVIPRSARSTQCSALSRRPSPPSFGPAQTNTPRDASPSSAIASTGATICRP